MSMLAIFMLAIALAMDAFTVSMAVGLAQPQVTPRQVFRLSFHFGLFQALMPIIGWGLGVAIYDWIEAFDHWVAFLLLAMVGGKMIFDAVKDEQPSQDAGDPTRGWSLVILSLATSMDALAVGLSLAMVGTSIWLPVLVIGLVALLATAIGLRLGQSIAGLGGWRRLTTATGGVLLLLIGFKVLWEHGALAHLMG